MKKHWLISGIVLPLCFSASVAQGPKIVTPTAGDKTHQKQNKKAKPTGSSSSNVTPPTRNLTPPEDPRKKLNYPWHMNITATIFWVGEKPTPRNPTPNHASSWDVKWQKNFGGFDNPDPAQRVKYRPKGFIPQQNTFYIALPYNDRINHKFHKPEASRVVPWWNRARPAPGKTTCKGRWVQIVYNKKVCYAQWEDCGPFTTDDWRYVFGGQKPSNTKNNGAGIDLSPAVRDYLGLKSGAKVHWRFIDFRHVPRYGPWTWYGTNNPFKDPKQDPDYDAKVRFNNYLKNLPYKKGYTQY